MMAVILAFRNLGPAVLRGDIQGDITTHLLVSEGQFTSAIACMDNGPRGRPGHPWIRSGFTRIFNVTLYIIMVWKSLIVNGDDE